MKFPSNWLTVRLGEVILDMQPGFAQAPGDDDTGVGQVRTHNVTPEGQISLEDLKYVSPSEKELEKYMLQKGDVVFNNTNSEEWVGKTALYELDEPLVFSNHMTRIRVREELIDPDFLARYLHFLWRVGFSKTRAKRWVSQAGIDQRELAAYKVPVLPLLEQQRIIEILKQVDTLRCQRQEIIKQAKQLSITLFLEMFGDPESWGSKHIKLGDISSFVTSGSRDWSKYYSSSSEDARFIRVQNVKAGELDLSDMAYVNPPENTEAERARVQPSDLLVSITGTVGQVAVVPEDIGEAYISQHVALVRADNTLPEEFLSDFLNHPVGGQLQIQRANYGQTKPGLNLEQIKKFMIPFFDEGLIHKYLEVKNEVISATDNMDLVRHDLVNLNQNLLAQAFSGELTEPWREANRDELEAWLTEHAEQFGKRPSSVKIETIAPAERKSPIRPARRWLMEQLSEVQNQVYLALQEWKGTLIPSADLDDFLSQWPVEHLEDAHDQLRRALDQLAGVGLIAKVSLPTDTGEYATGYRILREDELSKADDLERLGALT